jgi:hypothetical protein
MAFGHESLCRGIRRCDDFIEMVIPVLQRRGLFRTDYEGATLRENLGLKPAVSRYAGDAGTPTAVLWMPPGDPTRSMT